MNAEGLLVARLFLGVPFVIWGIQKLRGGEAQGLRAYIDFLKQRYPA